MRCWAALHLLVKRLSVVSDGLFRRSDHFVPSSFRLLGSRPGLTCVTKNNDASFMSKRKQTALLKEDNEELSRRWMTHLVMIPALESRGRKMQSEKQVSRVCVKRQQCGRKGQEARTTPTVRRKIGYQEIHKSNCHNYRASSASPPPSRRTISGRLGFELVSANVELRLSPQKGIDWL